MVRSDCKLCQSQATLIEQLVRHFTCSKLTAKRRTMDHQGVTHSKDGDRAAEYQSACGMWRPEGWNCGSCSGGVLL